MRALIRIIPVMVAVFAIPALCLNVSAQTDETAPAPATVETVTPAAPEATAPEAPPATATVTPARTVNPDPEIFRRTPVIDGRINDGEWDIFYTLGDAGSETLTCANWDSSNLYIGARSSRPLELLIVLDGNSDGWFHGEDNYELVTTRDASLVLLAVGRYESKGTKSAAATPVTQAEAALVEMKAASDDSVSGIEIRVPWALIRDFRPSADRKIGLQIAVKGTDGCWIPADVVGDTRNCAACSLAVRKIAALAPLRLGFDLRDSRVARGDELAGKFHMSNDGLDSVDVRSFVIAGEGRAGDYLSSQKVRMEGLASKKHISHTVTSLIPSDMPLGSWALGAEVRSADSKLAGALVSFDVVEPYEIETRLPPSDIRSDVKDVTFGLVVRNNKRAGIRGTVKITLPQGWELWRNADTREFSAAGGSMTSVAFKAKQPLGALGAIPVRFEVNAVGLTKTAEGTIIMVNP